jgi:hypothetical protein
MPTRRVKEDTSPGKEAVAEFIFFMLRPLYPENQKRPNMGPASLPPSLPSPVPSPVPSPLISAPARQGSARGRRRPADCGCSCTHPGNWEGSCQREGG